ncbi:hypothetical protein BRDID11018_75040 [Bradyrhizobium diazoefficiens]|nr:hypothetical protein XF15B_20000 [Bradyrhizobium diazoefficiens]
MGGLEDRTDPHGELLTALVALPQTEPDLAVFALYTLKATSLIDHATVRANHPVDPQQLFEMSEGRFLVVEVRVAEHRHGKIK